MTTDNKALAERLRKMADECEASEGLPGTFLKQCSGFVHDDLTEAARLIALREPSTPSAQVSGGGEHVAEMVRHAMKMTPSPKETCLDHEEYIEAVIDAALSTPFRDSGA